MNILQQTRTAIVMVVVLTVLTGILYPLAITGIAQVIFPRQANGSLVVDGSGTVVGSAIIAQQFSKPGYFHPRPSAAGQNGYDPTSSGGTNLGPTNPKLIQDVQSRTQAYRQENDLSPDTPVPVDAVTTSGSGLDPDISIANALLQAPRVAKARGLAVDQVRGLVEQHVQGRTLRILGEPRVNVLELNLALDQQKPASASAGGR
jgi:K+-transporting ATPase ATPase C chain